jgi:hypothetical protein
MKQNRPKTLAYYSNNNADNVVIKNLFLNLFYFLFLCALPFFVLEMIEKQLSVEYFIVFLGFTFIALYFITIPSSNIVLPFNTSIGLFISYAATVFWLGSLVLTLFSLQYDTMDWYILFWKAAYRGIFIAFIFLFIVRIINPDIFYEECRNTIIFGLFVGFFLLVPAIAILINGYWADSTVVCTAYDIENKTEQKIRHRRHTLHTNRPCEYEFEVGAAFYNKVKIGQNFKVCTKKGYLGYDFVVAYKTMEE